ASDPTRGLFILCFLALVVGGSLTLFALRSPAGSSSHYPVFSREAGLLANSLLLAVLLAVVVLGTLYPLIADALSLGKISVGPPYFNRFFFPLMAAILLLLPLGNTLQWQDNQGATPALLWLRKPAVLAMVIAPLLLLALAIPFSTLALIGSWLGSWVLASTVLDIQHKLRHARSVWHGLRSLRPSYWGMCIAHTGLAISALGIVFTSLASEQRDVRLAPHQAIDVAGYHFVFEQLENRVGPNYLAQQGLFSVSIGDTTRLLHPEKRQYMASRQVMTEAAIWPGLARDVYVSLGEALQPEAGAASAWSVRLHVKPAVRWIWLGAILMAIGATTTLYDKRYRQSADKPTDTL
ncbi:MAG: heme lyase NrfEFG subunit NrfE, partial [Pseudomonadales bacterium]|nr:heme lyase NrfEFG subunit NrfE [Pseudomonadales bacterium]